MDDFTKFSIRDGVRIAIPTIGLICGPQNSGKTTLLLNLICYRTKIFVNGDKIKNIYLMYSHPQPLYEVMKNEFGDSLTLIHGFDESYHEKHFIPPNSIYIFDDLDSEVFKSESIARLVKGYAHHNSTSLE